MKRVLTAVLLTCASLTAQAQQLPTPPSLPAYSGTVKLVTSLMLVGNAPIVFQADLYPKKSAKPGLACRLFGQVWGVGPYVVVVPGTTRLACPGQPVVSVLGAFEALGGEPAWTPTQEDHCLRTTQGYRNSRHCAESGSEVAYGTYAKWVTWAVVPDAVKSR